MTVLMMNYTASSNAFPEHFKRRFGVHRETFNQMVKALKPWRPTLKPGAKPKLMLEDRVLCVFGENIAPISHW